jgi:hypothetical protein
MKRTFITFSHGYQNNELTKILKKSISKFSDYGLVVYTAKDFCFDYNYDDPNFWKNGYGYIMKINSCLKSLKEYDEVVWLDTDIVVNHNIDNIWKKNIDLENYPLLPLNRFANYETLPIKIDQHQFDSYKQNLYEYFELIDTEWYNIDQLQACLMLFDIKSKDFLLEVLSHFDVNKLFLTNGDESIINGLLFKKKYRKNLGSIFLCSHFFHSNLRKFIDLPDKEFYPIVMNYPVKKNNFDDIIFFHGSKSLIISDLILSYLIKKTKNNNKTLGEIMRNNGSDKSTKHNYTQIYSTVFDKFKNKKINLFELGIGSIDDTIPWNMTSNGTPGASLYSWLEYFPKASIYAADIDEKILINTKKIKSFHCDQLDQHSIQKLWENPLVNDIEFDIMILDGVHTFDANMFFFGLSSHKIKQGGFFVIEDIHRTDIDRYRDEIPNLEYKFPTYEISLMELYKSNTILDDNTIMLFYKKKF